VETLKRDWKSELTLRDVLVTISCLLVYPNASSALNEEAGRLVEEDFGAFERRASLWTGIHAAVPKEMVGRVEEARRRGEVEEVKAVKGKGKKRLESDGSAKTSTESENTGSEVQGGRNGSDPFSSTADQRPAGLGLDFATSMQSFHTVGDMDITPIQPPPPRPTRKRYALNAPTSSQPSSSAESFSRPPVTPTPAAPSTPQQQLPVTPRPPDAKRLRLSPPSPIVQQEREQRPPPPVWNPTASSHKHNASDGSEMVSSEPELYSWITWWKNIPPSPPRLEGLEVNGPSRFFSGNRPRPRVGMGRL
jgi:ubiquitin-conjugating enzyme E2 S